MLSQVLRKQYIVKGCSSMKHIGVVICSYNGCEDTVKCIESLHGQTLQDFDIYVVDNASVDGTANRIRELFADEVQVLRQEENLGGAGGFGAGIAHMNCLGYDYIALMDNDIIVDEKAMEKMMACLEADESLGAVGAKILYMSTPDIIYDYSDVVDLDHQLLHSPYRNIRDNERLPKFISSDFVPATAGIFRRQAILEAGSMPVDNFIYYDDIEMGWNMLRKGWKLVCCGEARVWHKSSVVNRRHDNFGEYYFKRNTLNFTAKYIAEDKIEALVDNEINKVFPILYGCSFKGQWRKFETTFYAFDDFARHVRGKAKEGRIQPFTAGRGQGNKQLEKLFFAGYVSVRVIVEADADKGNMLLGLMRNLGLGVPQVRMTVLCHSSLEGLERLPLGKEVLLSGMDTSKFKSAPDDFKSEITIHYCGHVKNMKENVLPDVCVDSHYNVVDDECSWEYYQNYDVAFEAFRQMYREPMLAMIKELRSTVH